MTQALRRRLEAFVVKSDKPKRTRWTKRIRSKFLPSAKGYRSLFVYARPHRGLFLRGVVAALFVVAARLALPWPLRVFLSGSPDDAPGAGDSLAWLPPGIHPVLAMGGAFLLLLVFLGGMDFLERLFFGRFAIGTVRDLRASAFEALLEYHPDERRVGSGEVVSRLIGDCARIKTGLKGFLVHVATNATMFLGMIIVLFVIAPALAFLFLATGVVVMLVTLFGMSVIRSTSLEHRKKEGQLAQSITKAAKQKSFDSKFTEVNASSGHHEAAVTRLQGMATWSTHIVFGLAVLLALWIGMAGVGSGKLDTSDLFVFIAYALMIQQPVVTLTRQGTRSGKVIACAERVAKLLARPPEKLRKKERLKPLEHRLEISGVSVSTKKTERKEQGGRRLSGVSLRIRPGERVLLLGESGSGKSTFLELLAGFVEPIEGAIRWDDSALTDFGPIARSFQIDYLPHEPTWNRQRVRSLLCLADDALDEASRKTLDQTGAASVIDSLSRGLDERLRWERVSSVERRIMYLCRILFGKRSLWLLDDFTSGMSESAAYDAVKAALDAGRKEAGSATVIVANHRPVAVEHFDRVVELHQGEVRFNGPPTDWKASVDKSTGAERENENGGEPRRPAIGASTDQREDGDN